MGCSAPSQAWRMTQCSKLCGSEIHAVHTRADYLAHCASARPAKPCDTCPGPNRADRNQCEKWFSEEGLKAIGDGTLVMSAGLHVQDYDKGSQLQEIKLEELAALLRKHHPDHNYYFTVAPGRAAFSAASGPTPPEEEASQLSSIAPCFQLAKGAKAERRVRRAPRGARRRHRGRCPVRQLHARRQQDGLRALRRGQLGMPRQLAARAQLALFAPRRDERVGVHVTRKTSKEVWRRAGGRRAALLAGTVL